MVHIKKKNLKKKKNQFSKRKSTFWLMTIHFIYKRDPRSCV